MFHYKVGFSGSVPQAEASLSGAIGCWIQSCGQHYTGVLPDDNPAQASYAAGWVPWLRQQPEHAAIPWLSQMRDALDDHFTRHDLWYHGYWRKHEAGRGMEHFLVFLGGLWSLMPDDPVTVERVADAAEHLGNWNDAVEPWFDWDKGLFRSVYLGTDGPAHAEDYPYNIAMHVRGLDLALLAYRMTGQTRYLDLGLTGALRWADAITSQEAFPLALDGKTGLVRLPRREVARYAEFFFPGTMSGGDVQRAEAFLASGGVQLLVKLWQYAREPRLIAAAERTLDLLLPGLTDPNANGLVGALRFYRNHSGRMRYDDDVLQACEFLFPYFIESLNLDNYDRTGEGQRITPVSWRENNLARQHNPLLLGLAAEISGNERMAACALDLGTAYLELARFAFPNGRDNPFQGRSVSAVARGGIRDNGSGVITELWEPLRKRFCMDPTVRAKSLSRQPFPLRLARNAYSG